jgi:fatty acid desaturase
MANGTKPSLDPALSGMLHRIEHRHLGRIIVFLAIWGGSASVAIWIFSALGGAWWAWLVCLPFYILAGASLHGISLFTHEGVHGVLSQRLVLNHAIALASGLPVLQTFMAYKVLHLRHHKHLGAEGDPDHYPNYTEWTPMIWAMHWGRLILGYPTYIVAIPALGFQQGNLRERLWICFEVGLLLGLVALVVASPIPRYWLLHAWLVPMLMINVMVNIRGMSQHTLLEHATDVVQGTRTLLSGRVVQFFMCNENYHLEHHLYPGVPWYHLPRLHVVLHDELQQRSAPYLGSYLAFVGEFIRASLQARNVGSVNVAAAYSAPPGQGRK